MRLNKSDHTEGATQRNFLDRVSATMGQTNRLPGTRLTVALEREHLATFPVGTHRWATLGGTMGFATQAAVLHHRSDNPVDAGVTTDALVCRIHEDDLEELVARILGDPVRVEHAHTTTPASNSLLTHTPQRTPRLEGADTSVAGLAIHLTLVHWTLAATTADTHTVNAEPLLGLVPKTTSLVRASGLGRPVDGWHLPELPSAHALHEAQDIGLLSVPKLAKVFVCSHCRPSSVYHPWCSPC